MRAAVRERFGRSAAVFDEVGDATGYRGRRRRADCIAMGLWPSRGIHLEGIEIKVSRSDWIAELKSPEKADAIGKYCDFWWLAVADETIVKDGELPANWGLLVLDGTKLRCAKQAPKLEAEALDRGFVAALLRRAAEAQDQVRAAAFAEGCEKGRADAPQVQERDRSNAERDLEALRASLAAFELASGLTIDGWNGGIIGDVVAKIQRLRRFGNGDPTRAMDSAANALELFAKQIREQKATLAKELLIADKAPPMARRAG
jgi:hypothetical protein